MKDWHDNVIEFLNRNDDSFFSAEWLASNFNITIDIMNDFLDELESLDIVYHRRIYINLENKWLYKCVD